MHVGSGKDAACMGGMLAVGNRTHSQRTMTGGEECHMKQGVGGGVEDGVPHTRLDCACSVAGRRLAGLDRSECWHALQRSHQQKRSVYHVPVPGKPPCTGTRCPPCTAPPLPPAAVAAGSAGRGCRLGETDHPPWTDQAPRTRRRCAPTASGAHRQRCRGSRSTCTMQPHSAHRNTVSDIVSLL